MQGDGTHAQLLQHVQPAELWGQRPHQPLAAEVQPQHAALRRIARDTQPGAGVVGVIAAGVCGHWPEGDDTTTGQSAITRA